MSRTMLSNCAVRANMHTIRPFQPSDWPSLWPILQAIFAAGDSWPHPPDSSEADTYRTLIELPLATFVACDAAGQLVGYYYLKPNQPGLAAHVCNCGYVVTSAARGQGIARAMCLHSQQQALTHGFLAMQFNLVVSTNVRAVRLWQQMGFQIIGTLPKAFRHRELGLVDAYLMFKDLQPDTPDAQPAHAPGLQSIDHIHVFVADRAQAEAWYARVLGLHRIPALAFWASDGGPLTLSDASGKIHIALFERPAIPCRSTIAFGTSASEFLTWRTHLAAELGAPPKVSDHQLSWSMYFSDPDGNPYEITSYAYAELVPQLA